MADTFPLIDLSYILEISGNDPSYVSEVVGIFIDTMTAGLPILEQLVNDVPDYEKIHKQAHFLKSSAAIIKVRDNYDKLVKINAMSLSHAEITEIRALVASLVANYAEAMPDLIILREKKE